jgi:hypothetical protein
MNMRMHGWKWTKDNLDWLKKAGYISSGDCYANYVKWCQKKEVAPNSHIAFCIQLVEAGVLRKKASCIFYDFSELKLSSYKQVEIFSGQIKSFRKSLSDKGIASGAVESRSAMRLANGHKDLAEWYLLNGGRDVDRRMSAKAQLYLMVVEREASNE